MRAGFYTDAFNSACANFERCLDRAEKHDAHYIEERED